MWEVDTVILLSRMDYVPSQRSLRRQGSAMRMANPCQFGANFRSMVNQ
jgi:hypothetical protein